MHGVSGGADREGWRLHLPNDFSLGLDDVAAICLQDDLLAELRGETTVSDSRYWSVFTAFLYEAVAFLTFLASLTLPSAHSSSVTGHAHICAFP